MGEAEGVEVQRGPLGGTVSRSEWETEMSCQTGMNHRWFVGGPDAKEWKFKCEAGFMYSDRTPEQASGKKIDIVPHTGIAVFGKEYFFGGGPQTGIPGQSVPVPVAQVLELGQTSKTCEELETYIRNVLSLEHTEQKYDLLKHNCNHYADDVAKFLLDGRGLPSSIVNVAEEALSTPQGQSLKVMIENMERSMRSGGTSMNPFGSAAPPAVPAPLAAPDESSGELKVALAELAKNETEVRRTALQMLLKMTKNVEDNPSETKFRRIKMANPAQISVLSHAVTMVEGQQRWQGSIVVGFEPKAKGLRNGSCKNDIKHLQSYGHIYVSTLFHTYKYDYDYSLQDCTSTFACGHIDTCKRIVHVAHMQMNPLDSY
ncbi:unnamed protein product [Cladocopium goreaui]|uniref:Desumoylating isopeptidase 1 (DeSI-1) (PPPD E peptidase domain-containing protein 2) (Palmitoyl protein thioesterase DESI1) (Polyubiquitinated substrat e transporter) (POST) (S-depalmitoylase DESI1) n=1 Tax=Cladocopium goreaui TaxID=2562237 RepID=A0A9P1CPN4_9DINO|nr:unnamed protein product [Cladocopium goreaui]